MFPLRPTRSVLHLALSSHFGESFNPSASSGIITALISGGIGRVAFVRHGNTAPSETGADFDRLLTDLGRDQAQSAGSSYGRDLFEIPVGGCGGSAVGGGGFHPAALCSPAPRCVETANIFLDAAARRGGVTSPAPSSPLLVMFPDLYDGTMQPEGSRLFREIGYAPLRDYVERPHDDGCGGDRREVARSVLGDYARSALGAIRKVAEEGTLEADRRPPDTTTTLLLFAHAIYLPAAALGLAEACGCDGGGFRGTDLILSTNTKEAEGYLVDVDRQEIHLLQRP